MVNGSGTNHILVCLNRAPSSTSWCPCLTSVPFQTLRKLASHPVLHSFTTEMSDCIIVGLILHSINMLSSYGISRLSVEVLCIESPS